MNPQEDIQDYVAMGDCRGAAVFRRIEEAEQLDYHFKDINLRVRNHRSHYTITSHFTAPPFLCAYILSNYNHSKCKLVKCSSHSQYLFHVVILIE